MKPAAVVLAEASSSSWWPVARRILVGCIMVGVIGLLVWRARDIDWPAVWTSLREMEPWTLARGAALAALSYALYGCFELFGWHYLKHPLPRWKMMAVATSSYAVNLNLGTLIGGVGFRYRLYARLGLHVPEVAKLVGLSILINWLAYPLLLGICLVLQVVTLPADWDLPPDTLRVSGVALCLVPLAYLAACAKWSGKSWTIRGQKVTLPSARAALLQLLLSSANWLASAAAIHTLISSAEVSYLAVVSALMISAVAGVIAHIPGGLGVLEGVFIALLGSQIPHGPLLGALLAYRAIYYLAPLALATLTYLDIEATTRPHRRPQHPT
ncbi:MAG: UPF0104 family protein [Rubrivivax sp.]|nr:MAG: UPF0104 family protein [Rubrivivax sp.]